MSTRQSIIETSQIQLAALHRQKFGRKSEKLDEQITQLELKLEEFQADEAEDSALATEAVKAARAKYTRTPLPDLRTRQTARRPTQCASTMDGLFAGPQGRHPQAHLQDFKGAIRADDFAGYDKLYDGTRVEAACWAHVRRKFYDISQSHPSPIAGRRSGA